VWQTDYMMLVTEWNWLFDVPADMPRPIDARPLPPQGDTNHEKRRDDRNRQRRAQICARPEDGGHSGSSPGP
jgi:hypothetical protein